MDLLKPFDERAEMILEAVHSVRRMCGETLDKTALCMARESGCPYCAEIFDRIRSEFSRIAAEREEVKRQLSAQANDTRRYTSVTEHPEGGRRYASPQFGWDIWR